MNAIGKGIELEVRYAEQPASCFQHMSGQDPELDSESQVDHGKIGHSRQECPQIMETCINQTIRLTAGVHW